jgi:glycosyltransferase involved in cell wall biosynthesis
MSVSPLVSVVMPVYNGQRFLSQAIDSILVQTFTNFELIAVDDGSTDDTAKILDAFRGRDSRIVVHRQAKNSGIVAALNQGCRMARGELIARMDADDVSLPHRLSRQVAYLTANPGVGLVGASVRIMDAEGNLGRLKSYPVTPAAVAWSMLFYNSVAHPVVMFRRSMLEQAGFYPDGYPSAEDYALFARLARSTAIDNLPDVLLHYRAWSSNSTSRGWEKQEASATRIVCECVQAWSNITLSPDQAKLLRGLSRNDYPRSRSELRMLGDLLPRLFRDFACQRSSLNLSAARRDAAVRLWLLAAIAVRRAPELSATLAYRGTRMSPVSPWLFASKVARHLMTRDA